MKLYKLNKKLNKLDSRISAVLKDGCVQLVGTVDDYAVKVKAGQMAVDKRRYLGVLNDIELAGFKQEIVLPKESDNSLDGKRVDVLVIGGGITGAATLRELSRYKLKTLLVEKGPDLASGQSSRNGGVVHVGLNFSKGSQKLEYCVRGNNMYSRLAADMRVPYENVGQVTFARKPLEMLLLAGAALGGKSKGIGRLKLMSRDKLREYEPSVPDWSCGGLYMGTGGITCPHKMTIALAENAVENGAEVSLNTAVIDMSVEDGRIVSVLTNRGRIYPKAVINAAGVYSDVIAEMAGDRTFTVHPRIGTDIITDKKVGHLVNSSMGKTPFTLSPNQIDALPESRLASAFPGIGAFKHSPLSVIKATVKNLGSHSKGVGLIHSVDGNMLVGPNADEVPDREDMSTNSAVVNRIIEVQREVQPEFKASDVIAYFTGVRAPIYGEDFEVRPGIMTENIFEAGGVQSPGLTAAPAIAEDLAKWAAEYVASIADDGKPDASISDEGRPARSTSDKGNLAPDEGRPARSRSSKPELNTRFSPIRHAAPVLSELSIEERDALVKKNPAYGEIICRCEEISRGEIIDCLHSPIPVYTVDAVKKRVRPGMGRCQGSFCMPNVMKIISEEAGIPIDEVVKAGAESHIVLGRTKD